MEDEETIRMLENLHCHLGQVRHRGQDMCWAEEEINRSKEANVEKWAGCWSAVPSVGMRSRRRRREIGSTEPQQNPKTREHTHVKTNISSLHNLITLNI